MRSVRFRYSAVQRNEEGETVDRGVWEADEDGSNQRRHVPLFPRLGHSGRIPGWGQDGLRYGGAERAGHLDGRRVVAGRRRWLRPVPFGGGFGQHPFSCTGRRMGK